MLQDCDRSVTIQRGKQNCAVGRELARLRECIGNCLRSITLDGLSQRKRNAGSLKRR